MTATALFESPRVAALVAAALDEDAVSRDVTSAAVVPRSARGEGALVAKAEGVLAGLPLLAKGGPLLSAFPSVSIEVLVADGFRTKKGSILARMTGSARELLGLERTLLNFLQRLSGIATMTAAFVAAVSGTRARIQETRKTCPGFRDLDKYAVVVGGGLGHRRDLSERVLLKENHLVFAGLTRSPDAVRKAVKLARDAAPPGMIVEVETETLEQVDAALDAAADVVMLDDMTLDEMREAVRRRDARRSPAALEASGGVSLETVRAIAETGVDRVSIGALTHSVRALDLAIDLSAATS
jgi:nicotinate-nucleotide pyrophosphorylase (carboxylating)